MSKIGGGSQQQQTKTDPWDGLKPYLIGLDGKTGIMPEAENLYKTAAPKYYEGNTYAGMTNTGRTALNGLTGYLQSDKANVGGQTALDAGTGMLGRAQTLERRADNIASTPSASVFTGTDYKPALAQSLSGQVDMSAYNPMADAITSRVNRNFNESIMPSIRQGAVANGTLGGSRQGIAEGLAASRMNEDLGSSLSSLYGNAFTQAQNARNSIAPQMANLALGQQGQDRQYGLDTNRLSLDAGNQANDLISQGVGLLQMGAEQPIKNYQGLLDAGSLEQKDQQNQINADMDRWQFNQTAPWQNLQNYMGLVTGAGGRYGEGSMGGKSFGWDMDFTKIANSLGRAGSGGGGQ